uniref:Ribosomal_S7 domain-containing protein n=1 Tax=Globodera pallida TaxID=36090 RepID=A0A183CPW7_GLOPA
MIARFIRNFLNGQHIIHKIRQVQAVRLTFLHQCIKNECPPAAVLSLGARMASSSSSSNHPRQRSKRLRRARAVQVLLKMLKVADPARRQELMLAIKTAPIKRSLTHTVQAQQKGGAE